MDPRVESAPGRLLSGARVVGPQVPPPHLRPALAGALDIKTTGRGLGVTWAAGVRVGPAPEPAGFRSICGDPGFGVHS